MYGTPVNVSRSVQFWFPAVLPAHFVLVLFRSCSFSEDDGCFEFNCTCSHCESRPPDQLLVCDTEGLTRRSSRNDLIVCKQFILFSSSLFDRMASLTINVNAQTGISLKTY